MKQAVVDRSPLLVFHITTSWSGQIIILEAQLDRARRNTNYGG